MLARYVRPVWTDPVWRDGAGDAVAYGGRWGSDGPPADAYSVDSHPDRFAPLHLVADALIEHLAAGYDVQVSGDPAAAEDFLYPSAWSGWCG